MNAIKTTLRPAAVYLLIVCLAVIGPFGFSVSNWNIIGLSQAWANESCKNLFGKNYEYGKLKPDFKFNKNYTKEIVLDNEVVDQCSLQTCHLYAWTAHLENNYKRRTGESIKLSEDYLSMAHWFTSTLRTLNNASALNTLPVLTANLDSSQEFIESYGLFPKSVWTVKQDFRSPGNVNRVNHYLQNVIVRTTDLAKNVKTEEQKKQLAISALSQVLQIFEEFFGKIPKEFEFKGKIYTAKEFQQKLFPEISERPYLIDFTDVNDNRTERLKFLEKKVMQIIDSGQTVLLGYSHESSYVDLSTGIMSINAFPIFPGTKPLTRAQRKDYLISSGHAVLIVGYEKDSKTGELIKLKIRNSYGSEVGDGGYFHMYRDYFRAFAISIAFN